MACAVLSPMHRGACGGANEAHRKEFGPKDRQRVSSGSVLSLAIGWARFGAFQLNSRAAPCFPAALCSRLVIDVEFG